MHRSKSEGRRPVDLDWEELYRFHQEGILVEVEHVKAHCTKKEMQQMSLFERVISIGNEKADELANQRADNGWRTSGTCKSEHGLTGKKRKLCSIAICSKLSLFGGRLERL